MHLEQRTGNVPGLVFATVRQGMTTRTFPIEVRGGFEKPAGFETCSVIPFPVC
ncbi:hypothetical protein A0J51_00426 [Gluconobacter japonicus]|nr:hypothetical protein A0J51_00426 [Gluconobacter japonicus]